MASAQLQHSSKAQLPRWYSSLMQLPERLKIWHGTTAKGEHMFGTYVRLLINKQSVWKSVEFYEFFDLS